MIVDLALGPLSEPLTGRHWDRDTVLDRCRRRVGFYARRGLARADRVFLHYGNTPEFFVDLLAVWSLGGCAVPIDSRLTPFEVETLARAATPRFSLWSGAPGREPARRALRPRSVELVDARKPSARSARDRRRLPRRLVALDQDALILFTSGTTGPAEGRGAHASLAARALDGAAADLSASRAFRRTLCLLPTHFGHGLICNSLFPWLFGQHLFIVPPFKPDLLLRARRAARRARASRSCRRCPRSGVWR